MGHAIPIGAECPKCHRMSLRIEIRGDGIKIHECLSLSCSYYMMWRYSTTTFPVKSQDLYPAKGWQPVDYQYVDPDVFQ